MHTFAKGHLHYKHFWTENEMVHLYIYIIYTHVYLLMWRHIYLLQSNEVNYVLLNDAIGQIIVHFEHQSTQHHMQSNQKFGRKEVGLHESSGQSHHCTSYLC